MKKVLPFVVTFVVLAVCTYGGIIWYSVHQKQQNQTLDRCLQSLRAKDIQTANKLLASVSRDNIYEYFYHRESSPAFAAALNESTITITDARSAGRFIAAVDSWPEPLRTFAVRRVGKRAFRSLGHHFIFHTAEGKKIYDIFDAHTKLAADGTVKHPSLDVIDVPALFFIISSVTNSALIGFLLIAALLLQRKIIAASPVVREFYAGYELTVRQIWMILALYLSPLIIWIVAIYVLALHPYLYMNPRLEYSILLTSLTCTTLLLPVAVGLTVRINVGKIAERGHATDPPVKTIAWFSIINQYKYLLWRLWPMWLALFITGFVIIRSA